MEHRTAATAPIAPIENTMTAARLQDRP